MIHDTRLELAQRALIAVKELDRRTSLVRHCLALEAAGFLLEEIIYDEEHDGRDT